MTGPYAHDAERDVMGITQIRLSSMPRSRALYCPFQQNYGAALRGGETKSGQFLDDHGTHIDNIGRVTFQKVTNPPVCTENLDSDVMVMKSAKDRI